MYHPQTTAAREARLLSHPPFQRLFPNGLPTYSLADTAALTASLTAARTPEGTYTRRLSPDEDLFLASIPLRCAIDFPYWAERFVLIDDAGHGLRPLYPLWESQTYVLNRLGDLERERWSTHPDGLLVNILKARQLGVSTLAEALVAHRILYTPHTRGLSGADVEDQAGYLFRMVARFWDHLPFFLKPARLTFVKNREATFENGSFLKTAWGQSTRGALQTVSGQEGSKGAIGRGMTFSTLHVSELSTWSNPQQLDAALLPAIPVSPDTLVLFESTAEHAGDWWHQHWLASAKGVGRFTNIFIPVYAEPKKYSLPAPPSWSPNATTLAWAERCERTSVQWYPTRVTLSRDQLYWYETTYAYFEQKHDLPTLKREYCADDVECFQYAGRSLFSFDQLDAIDAAGCKRDLLDVWAVEPARDIAALRRLPDDDVGVPAEGSRPASTPAPQGRPPVRPTPPRPTPPLSLRIPTPTSAVAAVTFPVPPGYGFRRLSSEDLAGLASLRESVLAIWEYPRVRGPRRYVMGVDVGDGLDQDYSVIDIIRQPTLAEPAEQVAQYVSSAIDTQQLAYVCDAVGRFYADEDGLEALAAIETNNHGLATQDTLQLHLGYSHFYVWEYADSASPDRRFSTKIGWVTTSRTRPFLLAAFRDAITTRDPTTGWPDFILNSPITRGELRHFITPTGRLADAEAARGQHDDCVPPDTLIRCRSGVKPIQQVEVGEEVLTHRGRWRPVLRVGCREAAQVYDLTITGRRGLTVTGNHQLLLAFRQPKAGKPQGQGGTSSLFLHDLPEWRSIDDGEPLTNFSALSIPPMYEQDRAVVNLIEYAPATYNVVEDRLIAFTHGGRHENPKQARPPASLAVDQDFCRLLGYYYAEGSRGRHNVGWASHRLEVNIHAWLVTYLRRLGYQPSVQIKPPNGQVTSVGAVPLNGFFADFGCREQKQFPEWVLDLPPAKQREVLIGWLLGDGCFRNLNGGISAVTISATGATQLYEMAMRCGWPATFQHHPPQRRSLGKYPIWIMTFSARVSASIRDAIPPDLLRDKRPITTLPPVDRTRLRLQGGYLHGHICEVTPRPYGRVVFNLEVEEDHSYVANGTVVHNCVMAAAIAYYVAHRLAGGETEPIAEKRRRKALRDRAAASQPAVAWQARAHAVTAEEADARETDDEFADGVDGSDLYFDPRNRADV